MPTQKIGPGARMAALERLQECYKSVTSRKVIVKNMSTSVLITHSFTTLILNKTEVRI